MEVRRGYKQTEIGVIPSDWDVRKLGERSTFRTGPFGSALHKSDYTDGGVPVINPMHILNGQIVPTRTMTVIESAADHLSDFRLKAGDIVMGRRGDMGRCAVVQGYQVGWLCGTGSIIIRSSDDVVPNFLQRVLSSPRVVAAIEDTSVGSTMINLNQSTLAGLRIQFPQRPEQEAIADALSDSDALIESLEQFIAKKRQVKQGAMQELLSGKKRLPGFEVKPGFKQTELGVIPVDWDVKPLRALADKIMVGIASAATHAYRDRGIVMFRNQNIKPGRLDDSDILYIDPGYEAIFKNKRLKSGDLLTARTGYPGTTSIVPPQYEGAQSFTTLITRPSCDLIDPNYLCCFINSNAGQTYFEQNQIGGGQKNVNAGSLKYLPIPVPPTKIEQEAIATALSDMDAEITALEAKLNKSNQIKQGMVQELLTGRIRLV